MTQHEYHTRSLRINTAGAFHRLKVFRNENKTLDIAKTDGKIIGVWIVLSRPNQKGGYNKKLICS